MAIDFYNRPGDRRSYLDFVVHMHLAWQNLLHADRVRRHEPIFLREKNGRYVKDLDGTRKSWDRRSLTRIPSYQRKSGVLARIDAEGARR